jgi:hypothetical protein
MPETAAEHTYFRVEYTLAWDPEGQYHRAVVADPPVTLDEAVATHLRALNDYTTNGRWIRLDEARVVRAADVTSFKIVPVEKSSDDQALGFAVAAEEEVGPGSLLSREPG